MKILIMQPWISYRGAETTSVKQCYYLNKLGHEARIVASYVDWDRLPEHGYDVDYILPPKVLSDLCRRSKIALLFLAPILLVYLIFKHTKEFDVLNPHNLPTVWIAVIAGKIWKKKVVWTSHGIPEKVKWKDRKDLFDYFVWLVGSSRLDIWAVRMADVLCVTGSTIISDKIKKRYGKESKVIYPGVEKLGKTNPKLPKYSPMLLQVGALHSQKRQMTTLKVLKKLIKEYPKAGVVFVGDGPDRKNLELRAKNLGLEDHVYFAGFVDQQKLGGYYLSADLNLLPSVRETFPATPLEALAIGTPSVISSDSGIVSLVKDYVLVARPTVDDTYKKVLDYLENKRKHNSRARKGATYLKNNLSWIGYSKGFLEAAIKVQSQHVSSEVYDEAYFDIHHHTPVDDALKKERNIRLQRALDLLELRPGMRVLDLGSGNGEIAFKMVEMGCVVEGIDYSRDAVKIANRERRKLPKSKQKNARFQVMDAGNLSFRKNIFDRIVCLDVFEHIYPKPLQGVKQEMQRVIKPGGKIVIATAPNQFYLHPASWVASKIMGHGFESDEYHINVYNYFRFRQELSSFDGDVSVDVKNDGHTYFSSRIGANDDIPSWVKNIAKIIDYTFENPLSETIILNTPLKIFLAHDLWGVVDVSFHN